MTAITDAVDADRLPRRATACARARPGFVHDVRRHRRARAAAVPRDLEAVIPPVFIALFFFVVNIGTLQNLTEDNIAGLRLHRVPDADRDPARRHRRLACAGARARRPGRLLRPAAAHAGAAARDPARPHGRRRHRGDRADGADPRRSGSSSACASRRARSACSCSSCIAALWSLAFAGFGYAIALKTGNPAAVNSSFLLFFPFLFLTTSYVPRDQLRGWLDTVAGLNPVTYLLEGLRSLVLGGWEADAGQGAARHRWWWARQHVDVLRGAARTDPTAADDPVSRRRARAGLAASRAAGRT